MSSSPIHSAYSSTGEAWQQGPGRIYDRLAAELVSLSPVPMTGRVVIDLGAGTGAASRALLAVGARPIAVDAAAGMLLVDRENRPPAVVGDVCALPLADASVDGVVAAFSLNHVTDPVGGFRECARVVRPGGPILASAYAEDDTHPAKLAAETAARRHGWEPAGWYEEMRAEAAPLLATVERAVEACRGGGLEADVRYVRVAFPELGPADLVAWRFGMAQLAPFMASRPPEQRAAIEQQALALLAGANEPLVRSIIVMMAIC